MIGTITLISGNKISRPEYIAYRASLHAGATEDLVKICMARCERGDSDFPEDFPESLMDMASLICEDISRSGGEVDPVVEDQIHSRSHAAPKAIKEAEGIEVFPVGPTKCVELQIVDAAKGASKASYTELRELFDFGDNLAYVRPKDGMPVTPADWGRVWGFAADWTYSAGWVMADAAAHLDALGFSDALTQLASDFKLAKSTAYNYCRVSRRVPPTCEARKSLPLTTCVEIAAGRYDDDEVKNQEAIDELLQSAIDGGWNASEARSHAKMRKGIEEPVEGRKSLREQLSEMDRRVFSMTEALQKFISHYPGGINPDLDEACNMARACVKSP